MRVSIDVSPAVNGKAGLGRYAHTLALTIANLFPEQVHFFSNITSDAHWPESLADFPRTSVNASYKTWRMAVLLGQFTQFGWERYLPGSDVFHATEHLLLPLRKTPTILTVHDLIYRLYPEHHKKLNYWYLNLAMPLYCKRADHIIAVSHSTKNDLIEHYNISADKITVVYEAAAPHFTPQSTKDIEQVRQTYQLPERYLVTLGTIEPRKNYAKLVHALAILREKDPELKLVIIGSKGWLTERFYSALVEHKQRDAVILPGYVPDEVLPAMLAGATVAVVPSLYEGFGLPVLEAMACGVPVACSRTSSLGEIAGEAALTFDPENLEELTSVIQQLLDDPELAQSLGSKGIERAGTFSWERAARETWAVYEKVSG